MSDFVWMVADFYQAIFNKLHGTLIKYGDGINDVVSIGAILFACIVIGFVVNIFWKGARS